MIWILVGALVGTVVGAALIMKKLRDDSLKGL